MAANSRRGRNRPVADASSARRISFTNLDKVFFPEDGFTKGNLIHYYQAIAPWMLPYLRDRPVLLTRYPDGIHGKFFFQNAAPPGVPPWVRTVPMVGEDGELKQQFVCEDADTLAYLANLGAIPLHLWTARVSSLERPDWAILDLDPKTAPFEHVLTLARAARKLCDEMELPCFVKTTGSSGLHVLVPLGRQLDHPNGVAFAQVLAEVLAQRHPTIATTERIISARRGRVYVDYLQNGRGKQLVAPFAVRPLPGEPVAMPLRWSEITRSLTPRRFSARDAVARMEKLGKDPLVDVLTLTPDLGGALQRLRGALQR